MTRWCQAIKWVFIIIAPFNLFLLKWNVFSGTWCVTKWSSMGHMTTYNAPFILQIYSANSHPLARPPRLPSCDSYQTGRIKASVHFLQKMWSQQAHLFKVVLMLRHSWTRSEESTNCPLPCTWLGRVALIDRRESNTIPPTRSVQPVLLSWTSSYRWLDQWDSNLRSVAQLGSLYFTVCKVSEVSM